MASPLPGPQLPVGRQGRPWHDEPGMGGEGSRWHQDPEAGEMPGRRQLEQCSVVGTRAAMGLTWAARPPHRGGESVADGMLPLPNNHAPFLPSPSLLVRAPFHLPSLPARSASIRDVSGTLGLARTVCVLGVPILLCLTTSCELSRHTREVCTTQRLAAETNGVQCARVCRTTMRTTHPSTSPLPATPPPLPSYFPPPLTPTGENSTRLPQAFQMPVQSAQHSSKPHPSR